MVPEAPPVAATALPSASGAGPSAPGQAGPGAPPPSGGFGNFESPNAGPPQGKGTPWELGTGGAFASWRETMVQALFEPGKLFSSIDLEQGRKHLSFAIITGSIFLMVSQLIERFVIGPQTEQFRKMAQDMLGDRGQKLGPFVKSLMGVNTNSAATTIVLLFLAPLFVLVFLYANALVTHGFALLFGQSKRGFKATFAACAYSNATTVLMLVPGCGSPIAILWCVVLIGIGIKITHGASTGGATAVALGPYLLCCLGICALTTLGVTAAMQGAASGFQP